MFNAIVSSFSQYNFADLWMLLQTPSFYSVIFVLAGLEVVLGADNAIVLAIIVKVLPEEKRAKALEIGILCAYIFRFFAIGLGTLLIKFWYIKAIGGAYLIYIAGKYFYDKYFIKDENHNNVPDDLEQNWINNILNRVGIHLSLFVTTVITIEVMDIIFSIDSVLAAFGVSPSVWVLLIGGMLGIAAMRFAAKQFIKLLNVVPELESAAYFLIAFISMIFIIFKTRNR